MGAVQISGTVIASDSCSSVCGVGVGGANQAVFALGDSVCGVCPKNYQSVVSSQQPLQVLTAGLPGAAFVDLDILDGFVAIELLVARTNAKLFLRIDADVARVLGVGGAFPTTFAGGETLDLTIDGVNFLTTFLAADQSAAQVAARINAAAALAALPTPRAVVATSGQLELQSVQTGAQGSVVVVGGTGLATLGLTAGTTLGTGADIPVQGDVLLEFPRDTDAPARIQVSGQGTITVLAGGRTS